MQQIASNSAEQSMLGAFRKAVDEHNNPMMPLLYNPDKAAGFAKVVFDLLKWAG